MSILSFIKDAGEKILGFGRGGAQAAAAAPPAAAAARSTPGQGDGFGKGGTLAAGAPQAAASSTDSVGELSRSAGDAIAAHIRAQGLQVDGLAVSFDATTSTVSVSGTVEDQATKEKVVLTSGNVAGVASVEDDLVVDKPQPESQWHTVETGDNLSTIAQQFYGNANKYHQIFEANKPMLKDADKIYPGQKLRIPPLS